MKKQIKTLLAGLLAVLFLLTAASCGHGGNEGEEQDRSMENIKVFNDQTRNQSPVKPAQIFSDGAVLQRDMKVPVWGSASHRLEGRDVTVSFAGQKKTATVKDGAWRVDFEPMEASAEKRILTVSCSEASYEVKNVRVGEVILASGQSNMTFYVDYLSGETKQNILNDCDDPDISMLMMKEYMAEEPCRAVEEKWITPSPLNIDHSRISTVGFLVARQLRKELKVPVGVVVAAFGGTRIETWIPPKKLLEAEQSGVKIYGGVQKKCAYHAMIAPIIPYAFRAMMFYQGEGNSFPPEYAKDYGKLVSLMVETRREEFENPEMPFFQVQLPSYEKDCDFSEIRMQQQALDGNLKNCYTTINYDTGNPQDIHPSDKLKVGQRLADMMLVKLYGKDKDIAYPKAVSAEATGDGVMVLFETGDGGLKIVGDRVMSLEVAGEDGVYYPAGGYIEKGNRLIVTSDQVRFPYYVRYGYRSNLLPGSFFGANGLPVMPFELTLDINI